MIVDSKKSSSNPLLFRKGVRGGGNWGMSWEMTISRRSSNDKSIDLTEHRWTPCIVAGGRRHSIPCRC